MKQEVFPSASWCLGSHTMTLSTRYADISRCTAVAPDVSPTVNNSPRLHTVCYLYFQYRHRSHTLGMGIETKWLATRYEV